MSIHLVNRIIEDFYHANPNVRQRFLNDIKNDRSLESKLFELGDGISRVCRLSIEDAIMVGLLDMYFRWIGTTGNGDISRYDPMISRNDISDVGSIIDDFEAAMSRNQPQNRFSGSGYNAPSFNRGGNVNSQPYGARGGSSQQMTQRGGYDHRRLDIDISYGEGRSGRQSLSATTTTNRSKSEVDLINTTSRKVTFAVLPTITMDRQNMNREQHEKFHVAVMDSKKVSIPSPPTVNINDPGSLEVAKSKLDFDMYTPKTNQIVSTIYPIEGESGEDDLPVYSDANQWFSSRSASHLQTLENTGEKYMMYEVIDVRTELKLLKPEVGDQVVSGLQGAKLDNIDTILTALEDKGIAHRIDTSMLRNQILYNYNNIMISRLGVAPDTFSSSLDTFTPKPNINMMRGLMDYIGANTTCAIFEMLNVPMELQRAISEVLGDVSLDVENETIVMERKVAVGYVSVPVTAFMFGKAIKEHGYCMVTSDTLRELRDTVLELINDCDSVIIMTNDGYQLNITSTAEKNASDYKSPYGGIVFINNVSPIAHQNMVKRLYINNQ